MEHHGTSWRSDDASSSLPPSPPITPPSRHLPLDSSDIPQLALAPPARPAPPPMLRRSSSDLFDCTERHRRFGEVLARFIFCQIVATVCDLARIGIMHRDIKDENVTVEEGSWKVRSRASSGPRAQQLTLPRCAQVKLVDFGSAVLFNPAGPVPIQNESASSFADPSSCSQADRNLSLRTLPRHLHLRCARSLRRSSLRHATRRGLVTRSSPSRSPHRRTPLQLAGRRDGRSSATHKGGSLSAGCRRVGPVYGGEGGGADLAGRASCASLGLRAVPSVKHVVDGSMGISMLLSLSHKYTTLSLVD